MEGGVARCDDFLKIVMFMLSHGLESFVWKKVVNVIPTFGWWE